MTHSFLFRCHVGGKLLSFFLLSLILFCMFTPAAAQEAVSLSVFVERDSLTVYIPGNLPVSVLELGFEGTIGGQRRIYYLADYAGFASLRFDNVATPICFRLIADGSDDTLPLDCPPAQTFIHRLASADVFWYDFVAQSKITVLLLQGSNSIDTCPSGTPRCSLIYITPDGDSYRYCDSHFYAY